MLLEFNSISSMRKVRNLHEDRVRIIRKDLEPHQVYFLQKEELPSNFFQNYPYWEGDKPIFLPPDEHRKYPVALIGYMSGRLWDLPSGDRYTATGSMWYAIRTDKYPLLWLYAFYMLKVLNYLMRFVDNNPYL